ncbi:DUF3560 domain-containing protein [Streptomyces sp. NPDC053474]|uniref:DUF3560 domain-containing protein n=1 Tax=Streptomyces sp. NPDC053474 TaxID=3365704 RepID=UPI0037D5B3DE
MWAQTPGTPGYRRAFGEWVAAGWVDVPEAEAADAAEAAAETAEAAAESARETLTDAARVRDDVMHAYSEAFEREWGLLPLPEDCEYAARECAEFAKTLAACVTDVEASACEAAWEDSGAEDAWTEAEEEHDGRCMAAAESLFEAAEALTGHARTVARLTAVQVQRGHLAAAVDVDQDQPEPAPVEAEDPYPALVGPLPFSPEQVVEELEPGYERVIQWGTEWRMRSDHRGRVIEVYWVGTPPEQRHACDISRAHALETAIRCRSFSSVAFVPGALELVGLWDTTKVRCEMCESGWAWGRGDSPKLKIRVGGRYEVAVCNGRFHGGLLGLAPEEFTDGYKHVDQENAALVAYAAWVGGTGEKPLTVAEREAAKPPKKPQTAVSRPASAVKVGDIEFSADKRSATLSGHAYALTVSGRDYDVVHVASGERLTVEANAKGVRALPMAKRALLADAIARGQVLAAAVPEQPQPAVIPAQREAQRDPQPQEEQPDNVQEQLRAGVEAWRLPVDSQGRTVKVGMLAVQDFFEQTHARRVVRVYQNGNWLAEMVSDRDGSVTSDHTNRLAVVTQEQVDALVSVDVEDAGYRGRITQALVSQHAGQFRVVCQCEDGMEVCEPGHSRKIAWRATVEEARELWEQHCSAHTAAPVEETTDTAEIPAQRPGLYAPVVQHEEREGADAEECRAGGHRYVWLCVEAEGVARILRSYLTCACMGEKLGNFGRSGPSMSQGTQRKPLGIRDASTASALGVAQRNDHSIAGPWAVVSDTLKRAPVRWDHEVPAPAVIDPNSTAQRRRSAVPEHAAPCSKPSAWKMICGGGEVFNLVVPQPSKPAVAVDTCEPAVTEEDADIVIRHTHENGTTVEGSSKGDGVWEALKPLGWTYRRNPGIFIRGSRYKSGDRWKIDRAAKAVRVLGWSCAVVIEETMTFAQREAARVDAAEDRAERFEDRAGRAAAASQTAREVSDKISERFWMGQPILVGHHSEGRARRDQERMHNAMRRSIAEGERAGYWADRAQAAEAYERYRKNPGRTLRRIEKLEAERRGVLRQRDGDRYKAGRLRNPWWTEPSAERRAELDRLIAEYDEELTYWAEVIKEAERRGFKVWGKPDFVKGDFVRYRGTWYEVTRVNAKSLTIPHIHAAYDGGTVGAVGGCRVVTVAATATTRHKGSTYTAGYNDGVTDRMSAVQMAAALAGEPIPDDPRDVRSEPAADETEISGVEGQALAVLPDTETGPGGMEAWENEGGACEGITAPAAPLVICGGLFTPTAPKRQLNTGRRYWDSGARVTLDGRAGRTRQSDIKRGVRVVWDDGGELCATWEDPCALWLEGTEQPAPYVKPAHYGTDDFYLAPPAPKPYVRPDFYDDGDYLLAPPVVVAEPDPLEELRRELEELRADVETWAEDVAALAVAEAERVVADVARDLRAAELLELRREAAAVREELLEVVPVPVPTRVRPVRRALTAAAGWAVGLGSLAAAGFAEGWAEGMRQ